MELRYCEICGSLISPKRLGGNAADEADYVCDSCYESRRVVPRLDQASPSSPSLLRGSGTKSIIKFRCVHCQSLLQARTVSRKTRIRCPKCQGFFFLLAGGKTEAGASTGKKTPTPKPVPRRSEASSAGPGFDSEDRTRPISPGGDAASVTPPIPRAALNRLDADVPEPRAPSALSGTQPIIGRPRKIVAPPGAEIPEAYRTAPLAPIPSEARSPRSPKPSQAPEQQDSEEDRETFPPEPARESRATEGEGVPAGREPEWEDLPHPEPLARSGVKESISPILMGALLAPPIAALALLLLSWLPGDSAWGIGAGAARVIDRLGLVAERGIRAVNERSLRMPFRTAAPDETPPPENMPASGSAPAAEPPSPEPGKPLDAPGAETAEPPSPEPEMPPDDTGAENTEPPGER